MRTLEQVISDQKQEGRTEDARALAQARSKALYLTGGGNGTMYIDTVNSMGEAGGTCHMPTGKVTLRNDIVGESDRLETRELPDDVVDMQKVTHIMVHELLHRGKGGQEDRIWAEGVVDLKARRLTKHDGAEAYDEKVQTAERIENILGGEHEMLKAARGPQWQAKMTHQLVMKLMGRGFEVSTAQKRAEGLVREVD